MKSSLVLLALAGLATVTSAGPSETFSLNIGNISQSQDITGTGYVSFDILGDSSFGDWMLGGEFVLSTGNHSLITSMVWTPAAWSTFNTDGGYAGNGDYNAVTFGQFVLLPAFPAAVGSELGQSIGRFDIEVDVTGGAVIDFELLSTDRFTLKTIGSDGSLSSDDGTLLLGGGRAVFFPAPSSVAFLGLGGLVASRRRR